MNIFVERYSVRNFSSKKVDENIMEELREFRKESVVAIKGLVQEAGKAPNGVEIIPKEIKINEGCRL